MNSIQRFKPFVLCALFLMWAVAGCSQSHTQEQAILSTIEKNTQATQSENMEEYLSTIHPESPMYQSTKAMLAAVFATTDVKCSLLESKVEAINGDEATVRYTLLTESATPNDPKFRNNKTTQIVTMRKHNGEWKLYNGKIDKVEYVR